MMYGGWDGFPMSWGVMILGPFMMILFVVLTVLAIAWALRATGFGWDSSARAQSPVDILNARLARGEIDRAEYEERRKILTSS